MEHEEDGRVELASPVERLRRLLLAVVQNDSIRNQPAGKVVAFAVFREETDERLRWYAAILELNGLRDRAAAYCEERVAGYSGSPHELAFKEFYRILTSIVPEQSWVTYQAPLFSITTIALPLIVHATTRDKPFVVGSADDLRIIDDAAEGLAQAVTTSSAPDIVKRQLLAHVSALRLCLARYEAYGVDGIADAAATVVGGVLVHSKSTGSDKGVFEKTIELVNHVQDLVLKGAGLWVLARPALSGLLEALKQ